MLILLANIARFRDRFLEAMDDDFNTGGAVGILFEMRKTINGYIADHKMDGGSPTAEQIGDLRLSVTMMKELAVLIGVFRRPIQPADSATGSDDGFAAGLMELMIDVRALARTEKQWALADRIRDGLTDLKVTLEDRPDGTLWRRE